MARKKSCCKSSWIWCFSGCCRSKNKQQQQARKNRCSTSSRESCCCPKCCAIKGCSCFNQNCCSFKFCSINCCKVKLCPDCVRCCCGSCCLWTIYGPLIYFMHISKLIIVGPLFVSLCRYLKGIATILCDLLHYVDYWVYFFSFLSSILLYVLRWRLTP